MLDTYLAPHLDTLHREGRYRTFINITRLSPTKALWHTNTKTMPVTLWCSNDYLGMGLHQHVRNSIHDTLAQTGAGAGGTRNISGTTPWHSKLEKTLAGWHNKEAALVFSSAYMANDATLSTLAKLIPNLIVYSDALNHASLIEGIRRGGTTKRIFSHNNVEHLRTLLANDPKRFTKTHCL